MGTSEVALAGRTGEADDGMGSELQVRQQGAGQEDGWRPDPQGPSRVRHGRVS